MKLFDFKWPLALFLLGFLIQFTGALFKIRHWPMADEMITAGDYIFCAIAIVVAIIKIVIMKKGK